MCLNMGRSSASVETSKKKKLSDKIDKLSSIEHGEIFRKLKFHNVGFTQNSNGVFIDITDISMDIINELTIFVDHCLENQKMLKSSRQQQFTISLKPQTTTDIRNLINQQIQIDIEGTKENGRQYIEDNLTTSLGAPQEEQPLVIDPVKKIGSRFHNTRKKYSRPVATKVVYANELRKE